MHVNPSKHLRSFPIITSHMWNVVIPCSRANSKQTLYYVTQLSRYGRTRPGSVPALEAGELRNFVFVIQDDLVEHLHVPRHDADAALLNVLVVGRDEVAELLVVHLR